MSEYDGKYNSPDNNTTDRADLHEPPFRPSNDGELTPMSDDPIRHKRPKPKDVPLSDRLWMGARRFGKGALAGVGATVVHTRDIPTIIISGIVGGVLLGGEKLVKETRKVQGKPSWKEVIKECLEAIEIIIRRFKK